ncbi:conserved hypothetical protein [Xanthomonas oryzae pv. oryzae MAFF 311018]|nr:conserved hypothetical protein [Xanthomonas oryzae pv. oryzae MAFF 311018]
MRSACTARRAIRHPLHCHGVRMPVPSKTIGLIGGMRRWNELGIHPALLLHHQSACTPCLRRAALCKVVAVQRQFPCDTEILLLMDSTDAQLPLFDTTALHAETAALASVSD